MRINKVNSLLKFMLRVLIINPLCNGTVSKMNTINTSVDISTTIFNIFEKKRIIVSKC